MMTRAALQDTARQPRSAEAVNALLLNKREAVIPRHYAHACLHWRDFRGGAASMSTGRSAEYVLGGSDAERARLRAQADQYEASARWLLEAIGLRPGARVLDVGCGPFGILALLADAVGPAGEVVGLEQERRFVEMARAEVTRLGLGTLP
jgi:protein-L-isoaspartate O-methyltransferase